LFRERRRPSGERDGGAAVVEERGGRLGIELGKAGWMTEAGGLGGEERIVY